MAGLSRFIDMGMWTLGINGKAKKSWSAKGLSIQALHKINYNTNCT